jgi:hypothetical protein
MILAGSSLLLKSSVVTQTRGPSVGMRGRKGTFIDCRLKRLSSSSNFSFASIDSESVRARNFSKI